MLDILPLSLEDYLILPVPKLERLFGSWLKSNSSIMISGKEGIGKSLFINTLVLSISHGNSCFGWESGGAIPVGLMDGETDDARLQERLLKLRSGLGVQSGTLRVLTRWMYLNKNKEFPCLSMNKHQEMILKHFEGTKVLVVDNINCCFNINDENNTSEWLRVQEFVYKARSKGMSVILIHHTPKSNPKSPAGSSRNIRFIDYSMLLTRLENANANEVSFKFEILKTRDFDVDLVPFTAKLTQHGENSLVWEVDSENRKMTDKLMELKDSGLTYREIAEQTGVSKSTAQRIYESSKSDLSHVPTTRN